MKQILSKINWLTVAAICFGIALVFALIFGDIVGVHAADEVSTTVADSPFIIQSRSNQNLVYGFVDDGSRDHEPFLFYHSNGTIQNSTFAGSVPATYSYLYSTNVSGGWDGSLSVYNGFDMSLVYIVKGRIDTFDAPAASVWMSPNIAIGSFDVSRLSASDLAGYMTVYYLGMDNELYCFCCPENYLPSVYFISETGYVFSNYADMRLYRYDGQGSNGVWTPLMTFGGDYGLVLARPIREIFGAFTHNNNGGWSICPVRYIENDSPALDNYYSDHRLLFMRYFFADEVGSSGGGSSTPIPTPTTAPELQTHYIDYEIGTQRYIVTFEAASLLPTYAVPTASNPSYIYASNNYGVIDNAWGNYGVLLHGSIDCPSWYDQGSMSYKYNRDCSWLFFPASDVTNANLYITSNFLSSVSDIISSVTPISIDVKYDTHTFYYGDINSKHVCFHHLIYGDDVDLYCLISFPQSYRGSTSFHSADFEVVDTDDFLTGYTDYARYDTGYAPCQLYPQERNENSYLARWALPVAYKYGLDHSYAPPTPTPEPTPTSEPTPTPPPYVQVVTPTPAYQAPGITWLPPGFGDRIIDMGDMDTVTKDGIQQLQGSHSLGLLAACFALLPAPLQSLLWFLFFFAIVFAIVRLVLHFGGS